MFTACQTFYSWKAQIRCCIHQDGQTIWSIDHAVAQVTWGWCDCTPKLLQMHGSTHKQVASSWMSCLLVTVFEATNGLPFSFIGLGLIAKLLHLRMALFVNAAALSVIMLQWHVFLMKAVCYPLWTCWLQLWQCIHVLDTWRFRFSGCLIVPLVRSHMHCVRLYLLWQLTTVLHCQLKYAAAADDYIVDTTVVLLIGSVCLLGHKTLLVQFEAEISKSMQGFIKAW